MSDPCVSVPAYLLKLIGLIPVIVSAQLPPSDVPSNDLPTDLASPEVQTPAPPSTQPGALNSITPIGTVSGITISLQDYPYLSSTTDIGTLPVEYSASEICLIPFMSLFDTSSMTGIIQYGPVATCGDTTATYTGNPDCFPPGFTSQESPEAYQVYTKFNSCPGGWTAVASLTSTGDFQNTNGYLTSWLNEGEKATLCCPSSWNFASVLGKGGLISLACSSSNITPLSFYQVQLCTVSGVAPLVIARDYPSGFGVTGTAPIIALVESTTTSSAAAATPGSGITSSTASPTLTPDPDLQHKSHSHTVAIAVGTVIGVLGAISLATLIWYLYHRKQKRDKQETAPFLPPGIAELPGTHNPAELDGKPGPFEVDAIPEMPDNREWDRCATVAGGGRQNRQRKGETGWE